MTNRNKVLVVGAGGLLGRQLVAQLLRKGESVIAMDVALNKISELSNICNDKSKLQLVELDLTNEVAVKSFFSEQTNLKGAVNCSYPRNKQYGAHFFDVTLASFNENVSLHLGTSFLFAQQCALFFKRNQTEFSLVNIASIYGTVAPNFDVYNGTSMTMPVEYAAIKSAIIHLNKYIASYVSDSRFRINSVSPGGIIDKQPEAFLSQYQSCTLGKGMLAAEDVIGTILFLLSTESKYINGQNILVDDGFTL